MRAPVGLLVIVLAVVSGCRCNARPAVREKVDMHVHFGPDATDRMRGLMDAHGLDVVVNMSGGSPGKGLEQQLAAGAQLPGRVVVFAHPDWEEAFRGPGYGERMAASLERANELGAKGVKIGKHLGLTYRDHAGKLVMPDDPELDPMFDVAARLGMPVAIHTGDPVAFWLPVDGQNERADELLAHPSWSWHGKAMPWEELFASFERRVARSPKTTFIGVHFGNAPEYPERVGALLDKYPNLYVDTAARVPELGRYDAAKMKDLFVRHQDRILFGTDLQVGREEAALWLGSGGRTPPTPADVSRFFSATWRYFETSEENFEHPTPIQGRWTIDGIGLPEAVLKKLYAGNAKRLLGL